MSSVIRRPLALMAAAAMLGAGAFAGSAFPVTARQEAPRPQHIPTRRYYGYSFGYPNGQGWTVAQVKGMAKKRRNKLRHRRACK